MTISHTDFTVLSRLGFKRFDDQGFSITLIKGMIERQYSYDEILAFIIDAPGGAKVTFGTFLMKEAEANRSQKRYDFFDYIEEVLGYGKANREESLNFSTSQS